MAMASLPVGAFVMRFFALNSGKYQTGANDYEHS